MDIYKLTGGSYIDALKTVDNQFIREVYKLALTSAQQNKMASIVTGDYMSNRGEVADRNVKLGDKSILNICKLTPLAGLEGAKNVMEEIALYRWNSLGFTEGGKNFWKTKEATKTLFMDYILASCLCYIEVFDAKSPTVEKYYATRNRFIAGGVAGLTPQDTAKYVNHLTPTFPDYKFEQLKVLKLTQNKSGFKITQPKYALNFKEKTIRVTPVFLISAFVTGIIPSLQSNILKFKYIKDNTQERELISTLSPSILSRYYDTNCVQKMLNGCENKFERGYVRLPELGCSKYDDTGVRALNLSRITSIEVLPDIDTSFIDIDFSSILPSFKKALNEIKDPNVLCMLYQGLLNNVPRSNTVVDMKSDINAFVDGQFAIGTTTFLRFLHQYMMNFNMIFKNYTGKPIEFADMGSGFNLGVSD